MVVTSPAEVALGRYEEGVQAARARFATSPGLSAMLSPELEPALLELFLIYFSAIGVSLTEPVGSWICRAGARCEEIGLPGLSRALQMHAEHEAGHHLMMVRDTHALVDGWNARRTPSLAAERLLAQPPTPGALRHQQIHEDSIVSSTPYAQVAIQLEIEQLPIEYGPRLLDQFVRLLGPSVTERLSFLQEHIVLDVGHTRFNQKQLATLLRDHPEFVAPLVSAGAAILDAYAMFLNDCMELARDALSSRPV